MNKGVVLGWVAVVLYVMVGAWCFMILEKDVEASDAKVWWDTFDGLIADFEKQQQFFSPSANDTVSSSWGQCMTDSSTFISKGGRGGQLREDVQELMNLLNSDGLCSP